MTSTLDLQDLVNTGLAWRLEGHVGRTAMAAIDAGHVVLGETGHRDFWGNYVPSRYEVVPGTKGSQEYVDAHLEVCECELYDDDDFDPWEEDDDDLLD